MNMPPLKTVLSFDTSMLDASIALFHQGVFFERALQAGTQAKLLAPSIQSLLDEAGITMQTVDEIVTTIGPGSFTGLRIGLATAQGLCLARPHVLKTCTSLAAIAQDFFIHHPDALHTQLWLNAGKGEAYTQIFTRTDTLALPISDISLQPVTTVTATSGDGYATCGNVAGVSYLTPYVRAAILCEMAKLLPSCQIEDAMPLYIRPPDAKEPKPLPWLAKRV